MPGVGGGPWRDPWGEGTEAENRWGLRREGVKVGERMVFATRTACTQVTRRLAWLSKGLPGWGQGSELHGAWRAGKDGSGRNHMQPWGPGQELWRFPKRTGETWAGFPSRRVAFHHARAVRAQLKTLVLQPALPTWPSFSSSTVGLPNVRVRPPRTARPSAAVPTHHDRGCLVKTLSPCCTDPHTAGLMETFPKWFSLQLRRLLGRSLLQAFLPPRRLHPTVLLQGSASQKGSPRLIWRSNELENLGCQDAGQSRPISVCSSSPLSNWISYVYEYKYCCSDPWWTGKQTDYISFNRLRFPKTDGHRFFSFNLKWTQVPLDVDKINDLRRNQLACEKKFG